MDSRYRDILDPSRERTDNFRPDKIVIVLMGSYQYGGFESIP